MSNEDAPSIPPLYVRLAELDATMKGTALVYSMQLSLLFQSFWFKGSVLLNHILSIVVIFVLEFFRSRLTRDSRLTLDDKNEAANGAKRCRPLRNSSNQ
jgi:hypothetical protein